ncbi:hypothetical protein PG985_003718 [Apiospora marii]|uniref:uncharacterized protein n=1 Tax=Apiospora marii TaxID=335849 RepID=UPI0031311A2A
MRNFLSEEAPDFPIAPPIDLSRQVPGARSPSSLFSSLGQGHAIDLMDRIICFLSNLINSSLGSLGTGLFLLGASVFFIGTLGLCIGALCLHDHDRPIGLLGLCGNDVVGSVEHILHVSLVLVVRGFLVALIKPKLPDGVLFGLHLCQKAHDLPVPFFHQLRLGCLKFLVLSKELLAGVLGLSELRLGSLVALALLTELLLNLFQSALELLVRASFLIQVPLHPGLFQPQRPRLVTETMDLLLETSVVPA